MAASGSFNTTGYQNRYLTFSWEETSQSINNNKTTISWTLKGGGGASSYYLTQNIKITIDGQTVFTHTKAQNGQIKLSNGTVVATGTYTFTHDDDGEKDFTVYVEAGIYVWEPNCSGTKTFTLDTIPRKSTMAFLNGTLGVKQKFTITQHSSSFTHTIRYSIGDDFWTIVSKSKELSIEWTPPMARASYNPNGNSLTMVFEIITYNGSTEIGTNTYTRNYTIPKTAPAVSASVVDPTGNKDTYGYFVQGLSKCKVTIDASEAYGSPITAYHAIIDDVPYSGEEVTTGLLLKSGTLSVSVSATDKRGAKGTWAGDYNVLDYSAPTVSAIAVHRCDADGTENGEGEYIMVTFSAAVTALRDRNTAEYTLRYKKSTETNYTTKNFSDLANQYTVSGASYIFPADSNFSYDIEVTATDNHSTYTRTTSASTAFTIMNWHENGRAMGIGMVSEATGLAVGIPMKLYGGIESVAANLAKSSRAALGFGKHLWGTGDWNASNTTITVAELQNYTLLRLKVKGVNANILAFNNGGNLRGLGGYAENNRHRSYSLSAVVDGTTLTLTVCSLILHNSNGSHSTAENVSISDIWGIF